MNGNKREEPFPKRRKWRFWAAEKKGEKKKSEVIHGKVQVVQKASKKPFCNLNRQGLSLE